MRKPLELAGERYGRLLGRLQGTDTAGVLSLELRRTKTDIRKKRRELGLVPDNRRRSSLRPPANHPPLGSTA